MKPWEKEQLQWIIVFYLCFLTQSLNLGAAFVESEIGNKKFAEYMLKLGIGEETGIDLPSETFGLVSNLSSTRDLEYATASFGQGIAMTPAETVRALSALANGGKLITPHFITFKESKALEQLEEVEKGYEEQEQEQSEFLKQAEEARKLLRELANGREGN